MKYTLKPFPRLEEVPSTLEDALRYICKVTEYRMRLEAELHERRDTLTILQRQIIDEVLGETK